MNLPTLDELDEVALLLSGGMAGFDQCGPETRLQIVALAQQAALIETLADLPTQIAVNIEESEVIGKIAAELNEIDKSLFEPLKAVGEWFTASKVYYP